MDVSTSSLYISPRSTTTTTTTTTTTNLSLHRQFSTQNLQVPSTLARYLKSNYIHDQSSSLAQEPTIPLSHQARELDPSREDFQCSRYGLDDLWRLQEEEEERSLIHLASQKFDESLLVNSLSKSVLSPCYEEEEEPPSFPSSARSSISSQLSSYTTDSLQSRQHTGHKFHSRSRSLIEPPTYLYPHDETMTTLAHRPESPPELTSSKSSKSSSFHSSTFSGIDGTVSSDFSHFEDIGLDDEKPHNASHGGSRRVSKKASIRNLVGPSGTSNSATPTMRELVNGANRTPIASSKLEIGVAPMSTLGLPSGARRATSPARAISHTIRDRSRSRSRSRSPSPAHMMQGPISPSSMGPRSPLPRPSSSAAIKRLSSGSVVQKPRKTAKEIEAEYNDSDEDLPDDASLWNVPMSPKMYRTASAATSAQASASTSPERKSQTGTPKASNATPALEPKTAPVAATEFPSGVQSTPSSPNFSRLTRGNTTGTMPDTYAFGKGRTRSWNAALSDLSEEARTLSEALDAYAVEKAQKSDVSVDEITDSDAAPPKPLRSKSSFVELPPLRTNNVMIDPLPISKEKEKVLSRTRPSWLPPKNPKEEKKHLKEYQRMMEQSLEAEKRRAVKEASDKCARDDTQATLQRLWSDHVLPHWENSIREPRTRELWWRGIPSAIRAEVWKRGITNQLEVTATTYQKALDRAQAIEIPATVPSSHSESVPNEVAWLQAIRRDVSSTFPTLNLFQPSQPLHQPLINLLSAYAFYRSDVGYIYGSHLPAAILLLTLPTVEEAFVSLANLLNRPLPQAFLLGDPAGTVRAYELVLRLLSQKRPKLHAHIFGSTSEGGLGMTGEEVLEPLLRTLFLNGCCQPSIAPPRRSRSRSPSATAFTADDLQSTPTPSEQETRSLSLPLALRLWDIIIFDGDSSIIRAMVGLIAAKESALYGTRKEVLNILGWGGDMGLGLEGPEAEEEVERIIGLARDVGKEDRAERKKKERKKSEGDGK